MSNIAECDVQLRRQVDLPAAFQRMAADGRLFDALPIGIYFCDRDGKLLHFNGEAALLWGRTPALGEADERFCGAAKLFSIDGTLLPHDCSPMANVLQTGVPARDRTVTIERPDGTRITVLVNIEPVVDEDGELVGAVNCFRDVSELQRSREALENKRRRLNALLEALPAAVYTTDAAGRVTFYNDAAVKLAGGHPDLGTAEWCVSFRLYWPDGRFMSHDECPMAIALKEQRAIQGAEAVAERPDGSRVPFLAFPTPLYDEAGQLTGAVNMLVDISDRKEAEQRQQLLISELNHRVKNTLAMVQAVASQTLHRTKGPAEFVSSFTGRLQALARAHGLLTHSTWRGAGVMELVRDQLLLGGPEDERITCAGPSLMLEPQPALHLALALHELGTNARKHGSLSVPHGRLAVSWTVQSKGERSLLLHWNESGGPAVTTPPSRGFGTSLVEQSMQADGGEATICYGAAGVACEIRLPLIERGRVVDEAGANATAPTWTGRPPQKAGSRRAGIAGRRVLVVEDEALVAMDIVATLEAAGCEVVGPAASLKKAKELIVGERFDAALLDANLAGASVEEVAHMLTQLEIPFAFVTGYGPDGLPKSFAAAPILGKPFSGVELRATLERLIRPSLKVVRLRQGA